MTNKLMQILLLSLAAVLCVAAAGAASAQEAEMGDLVKVHYTAEAEDGKVFYTTDKEKAEDPDIEKSEWFRPAQQLGPDYIVAGEQTDFPAVGNKVIGMEEGETRRVVLEPSEAFGESNPEMLQHLDKVLSIPRQMQMGPQEFVSRFNAFPVTGAEHELNPHVRFKVESFTEEQAGLEVQADDGAAYDGPYGKTTVRVAEDEIQLRLDPEIGARVQGQGQGGRQMQGFVTSQNATHFTIDYNPPLAGKKVTLELELVSLEKTSELENVALDWKEPESEEVSLEEFHERGRPVVAVLHTERCGYCRMMFSGMEDLRIKKLRNDFVWVKVDVEKFPKYKADYNLSGTPLTVVLDENGKVVKRVSGYQKPGALYKTLSELL